MATLATHVHATGPDGERVILPPGEPVPAWAEVAITNPGAWADPPTAPEPVSAPGKARSVKDAPRSADQQ